jgi:hypothetical protein
MLVRNCGDSQGQDNVTCPGNHCEREGFDGNNASVLYIYRNPTLHKAQVLHVQHAAWGLVATDKFFWGFPLYLLNMRVCEGSICTPGYACPKVGPPKNRQVEASIPD